MVMYILHRLVYYMNNACSAYQCFGMDHFGWGSTEAALYSDAVLYLYVTMRSCDHSLFIAHLIVQGFWYFTVLVVVSVPLLHLSW